VLLPTLLGQFRLVLIIIGSLVAALVIIHIPTFQAPILAEGNSFVVLSYHRSSRPSGSKTWWVCQLSMVNWGYRQQRERDWFQSGHHFPFINLVVKIEKLYIIVQ